MRRGVQVYKLGANAAPQGELFAALTGDGFGAMFPLVNTIVATKHERDLVRVMVVGTAISFGFMFALLQTLRVDASGWSFTISLGTAVAFLVGAGLTTGAWVLALRGRGAGQRNPLRLLSPIVLVVGLVGFLYPLRFMPVEKLPDIAIGLCLATLALSIVGMLIWQISRFLEQEAREQDSPPPTGTGRE